MVACSSPIPATAAVPSVGPLIVNPNPFQEIRPPSAEVLEHLDIATLVHRAQVYLESGHPSAALPFIRTAVRKAPLRHDLRRLLVQAIEAGADAGEAPAPAAPLPDDWQRQYAPAPAESRVTPDPVSIELSDLRHTFMRPRDHPGSPRLVLLTIAFVIGSVAAMTAAWSLLRGRLPSSEISPSSSVASAGKAPAGVSEDPARWILLEIEEYEAAGKFAEGIERAGSIADAALRRPVLVRLYAKQAAAFEKAGRLESARTAYENAIAHDAANLELIRKLGGVLYELGRHRQPTDREAALDIYTRAQDILDRALVISPSDTASLLLLARIEIARDDDAGAADKLRKIVQLDPGGSDAVKAREILAQRNLRL